LNFPACANKGINNDVKFKQSGIKNEFR